MTTAALAHTARPTSVLRAALDGLVAAVGSLVGLDWDELRDGQRRPRARRRGAARA